MPASRVDVLAYEGCFGSEVFGLVDLLAIANTVSAALRPGEPEPFRARIVSAGGRSVRLSGAGPLRCEPAGAETDLLVVPGWRLPAAREVDGQLAACRREVALLRALPAGAPRLVSVCGGAFLLAEAGRLDGRRATTAWLYAPELARRYPTVDVLATSIVVHDGDVSTSGAFSAVQELAIGLVHSVAGAEVARLTSAVALVPGTRTTQAPYVQEGMLAVAAATFSGDVKHWLRGHLADRYDLDTLAAAFHVSPRTLLRRFSAETGTTPLAYLQNARVTAARRLLETSDRGVADIMARVGYADAATFRRLFTERVGLTPSDYRRHFRPRT